MSLISDREPTIRVNDADRRLVYRWTLRRIEEGSDPGMLLVQLKVQHDRTGKRYYAELRNATLTDTNFLVESFGWNDPVWSRDEFVARYAKTGLRAFADRTFAELRRADAAGEDLHVDLTSDDRPSPPEVDTTPDVTG